MWLFWVFTFKMYGTGGINFTCLFVPFQVLSGKRNIGLLQNPHPDLSFIWTEPLENLFGDVWIGNKVISKLCYEVDC